MTMPDVQLLDHEQYLQLLEQTTSMCRGVKYVDMYAGTVWTINQHIVQLEMGVHMAVEEKFKNEERGL